MAGKTQISGMFREKNIPLTGHIDLTYKCNLRCRHCCVVQEEREELSFDEVRYILDQLYEMKTFALIFSGGEALTRPDILEILDYARQLNFRINLYTNGTFIDSHFADELKKIRIDSLGVSLYGVKPRTHDGITCVAGSHAATLEAISLLRDRNINITLKSTIMQPNFHELDALHNWSSEKNIFHEFSYTIVPMLNKSQENLKLRLTNHQCKVFLTKPWAYSFAQSRLNNDERSKKKGLCSAGVSSFNISAYGDVHPCEYLRLKAGNIRERSFSEIWKSSSVLLQIRSTNFSDLHKCSTCDLADKWCNICPGLAWLEHGDWLGPALEGCRKALIRREIYG